MEQGRPAFDRSAFERRHGNAAQRIWTNGVPFVGGIYQQVGDVVPGTWYAAEVVWSAVVATDGDNVRRRVGIDPYGGMDPLSPNVVWGEEVWPETEKFHALHASAVAQTPTVTLFVRVNVPYSLGSDQAFIDVVSLVVDTTQPIPTPTGLPPTATPTPTPTPLPPTATPTPSPTPTPTYTPPPTDTPSPTFTPTPSPTSTPLPPTATHTPSPTPSSLPPTPLTRGVSASPTPTPPAPPEPSPEARGIAADLSLYLTLGSFGAAGVLLILAIRLWKRIF